MENSKITARHFEKRFGHTFPRQSRHWFIDGAPAIYGDGFLALRFDLGPPGNRGVDMLIAKRHIFASEKFFNRFYVKLALDFIKRHSEE